MSDSQYVAELLPRIRSILEASDLGTISSKGVRKQLIAEGEDEATIKAHRKEIDERIGEIYAELTPEEEEEPPSPESPPAKPLSASKPKAKPEPKNSSGSTESDAQIAARMQAEFDAAAAGGRGGRRAAAPAPKKKTTPKKKSKKRSASDVEDSDGEKPKKKRGGGGGAFNKELILSDSLAAFTNEARLSRPQTVKRIWDYVKANDLQDPSDKRFIMCDDALKSVFHVEKLHMFTMNKLLAAHFRDPDHVVAP